RRGRLGDNGDHGGGALHVRCRRRVEAATAAEPRAAAAARNRENPREFSAGGIGKNRCGAGPESPISLCERLFRIP
ncbi:hypothetical protein OH413_26045, partial [Salmonella enterica]|nr:hypothetical protein [Salmonella enterica]